MAKILTSSIIALLFLSATSASHASCFKQNIALDPENSKIYCCNSHRGANDVIITAAVLGALGAVFTFGASAVAAGAVIGGVAGADQGKKAVDYDKKDGVLYGFRIFGTFPNIQVCKREKGYDRFVDGDEAVCPGFLKESFDYATMETIAQRNGTQADCWRWKCKEADWAFNPDKTKCEKKDPNLEYSEDGIPVFPCDTKSTVTVNGKTVPANTRMNGACVPTCESDAASSIDTSDPTEFIINLSR
ncbi:MAG: hypothetical protein FWF97_00550 [Alphaproteobacteria bacterium]|nr:hypothetical protein [Alphaproteobacteria bacterium]